VSSVRRLYSLQTALPLALMVVLAIALVMAVLDANLRIRADLQREARHHAMEIATEVARSAERASRGQSVSLGSDLTLKAAGEMVDFIAMIDPEGTVVLASRLAWRGEEAARVIPDFDRSVFDRVVIDHQRRLVESADGRHVRALVPYDERTTEARLRNLAQGAILVDLDLSHPFEAAQHESLHHLARQLGVALVLMIGLGWLLRAKVTRPLGRLESASVEFAATGTVREPVPESGPREVAQLASNFNQMTQRIGQARAEIETGAARLSAVVDAAMDAIITVGSDHRVRMINPAGALMFGRAQEAIVGQPLGDLLPQRFRERHVQQIERFARVGESLRVMGRQALVHGLRADGSEFPAEATISRVRVDGEDLMTVILRDVTERLRAEKAFRELNDSLEQRVAQRTADLAEPN